MSNADKLKIVIGLLSLLLVAFYVGHSLAQKPCVGRFQLLPTVPNMAVDTKTGVLCFLYDPIGNGSDKIPLRRNLR